MLRIFQFASGLDLHGASSRMRPARRSNILASILLAASSPRICRANTAATTFIPTPATVAYFAAKGMNIIRVPVLWERIQQQVGGELDAQEMRRLDAVIDHAASKGMRVIVDVHNYAAYHGSIIGTKSLPTNALGDLWRRIAERYKDNETVVFGLMNEPNSLPTETWLEAANIAIAEIRRTGAKNLILVPGNGWSSARDWAERRLRNAQ